MYEHIGMMKNKQDKSSVLHRQRNLEVKYDPLAIFQEIKLKF